MKTARFNIDIAVEDLDEDLLGHFGDYVKARFEDTAIRVMSAERSSVTPLPRQP
jgi:hypothetical protein